VNQPSVTVNPTRVDGTILKINLTAEPLSFGKKGTVLKAVYLRKTKRYIVNKIWRSEQQ
jgi:hypothetical protein